MSFIDIPIEAVPTMLGQLVHVRGWTHGCVFRLVGVEGHMAKLETPKTRKQYTAPINQLQYTRRNQPHEPQPKQ